MREGLGDFPSSDDIRKEIVPTRIRTVDGESVRVDYGHVVNFYLTKIKKDDFYAQLPEVCRLVKIVLAKLGELGYLAGGTFV